MDCGLEGGGVVGGRGAVRWEWDGGIGTRADEESSDVEMAFVGSVVESGEPIAVALIDRGISSVSEEGIDDIQMAISGRLVERSPSLIVLLVG